MSLRFTSHAKHRSVRHARQAWLFAWLAAAVACGGGGDPVVTVREVNVSAASTSLLVGASTLVTAQVIGVDGNPMNGAAVTWSSLSPTVVSVSATGLATALAPGQATVRATSGGRSGDVAITVANPPAATVAFDKDSTILTLPAGSATLTPVAKDATGRALVNPTFFFASDNPKVATVSQLGVVTAVAAGVSVVTASTDGKTGSLRVRVTANATGTSPRITAVSALAAGASGTITGSNFASSVSGNVVLVEGVPATVTAATTTQLSITLPTTGWACDADRAVSVQVNANNESGVGTATLRTATRRTLAVGQSVVLSAASDARCNELANTGGTYLVTAYNVSRTLIGGDAAFTLRGATNPGVAAAASHASAVSGDPAAAVAPQPVVSRAGTTREAMPSWLRSRLGGASSLRASSDDAVERLRARDRHHADVLDRNAAFVRAAGSATEAWRTQRRLFSQSETAVSAAARQHQVSTVGAITTIKIPNLDAANLCSNGISIGARTVWVGQHAIIVEDTIATLNGTATIKGQSDSLYAQLGQEFDTVMWPVLTQYFGNPMAMDAQTPSKLGKIVMVFSPRVNAMAAGTIEGFVAVCDFYPTSQAPTSNLGEYFYAVVPTSLTAGYGAGTRLNWLRSMRGTVMHESKHITAYAERIARNASLEETWLEEGTARHAEEQYARSIYGVTWKSNVGYQASVYCDQRPASASAPQCADRPIVMLRHFDALYQYLQSPEIYSVLGRVAFGDATYYATAWSIVRWMIDHYSTSESAFLQGLVQSTRSGVANLEARVTGTTWEEILGEWALTLYTDDYPNVTFANTRLRFPSWNLRDQFLGLCNDKGPCANPANPSNLYPLAYPFVPRAVSYGAFSTTVSPLGAGTFTSWLISGTQSAPQLLDLRGSAGGEPPGQVRIAIVRVQ